MKAPTLFLFMGPKPEGYRYREHHAGTSDYGGTGLTEAQYFLLRAIVKGDRLFVYPVARGVREIYMDGEMEPTVPMINLLTRKGYLKAEGEEYKPTELCHELVESRRNRDATV